MDKWVVIHTFQSYLIHEDYFLGTLSVRETLTYSAQLRLPSEMTNNEVNEIVEKTIIKMGLQDCAENKIGNWHFRGISKGEKRRLSISIEILTQPRVLFLDEVTSGLDSASAFFVLQVLRKIAHGRIVVCSIHQPSSHLFDLFDDLLLLSCGETIYFGDAKSAVKVINQFDAFYVNIYSKNFTKRTMRFTNIYRYIHILSYSSLLKRVFLVQWEGILLTTSFVVLILTSTRLLQVQDNILKENLYAC